MAVLLGLLACERAPEGRYPIDVVDVRGANAIDPDEIEQVLATTASPKFLLFFRGLVYDYEIFDRFVLQRDLARVERFYRSRGYYEAHARAGRVFELSDHHVRVEIVVEEGKPVVVDEMKLDGLDGLPKAVTDVVHAAGTTNLVPGKPLEEAKFAAAEGAIRRALTDRGYAYAKVERAAAVDLVAHTADITFTVTPGPLATFGAVTIEGLDALPDAPIRRAIDIHPGDPYSTQAIDDATQAALDLGVMSSIRITPDLPNPPPASRIVPIRVEVEPARLRAVRLGGGFELDATKTDVHLLARWENHNFFGGLRDFQAELRPGVVLYPLRIDNFVKPTAVLPEEKLRTQFRQPGFIEARTNAFVRNEFNIYPFLPPKLPASSAVLGFRELRSGLGVDRVFWKLYASFVYNLSLENPFTYKGDLDPALTTLVISAPELITNLDLRNDKIHPHEGVFIGNDLQFAGGPFGGNVSDLKIQPEVRAYVPLAKKVTLALRGALGFLFARNYGDVIKDRLDQPLTDANRAERTRDFQIMYFRGLFSGGPSSNRGYPFRGIGPHSLVPFLNPEVASQQIALECNKPVLTPDDIARCSVTVGGMTLWEVSVDLRFAITGPLEGAIFCDASDVSPRTASFRFDRPHLSCGVGGRYDTPVGPIRLDIGYRIPGLQGTSVVTSGPPAPPGTKAYDDQVEGSPGTLFGLPIAVAFGIGEPF